MMWIRGARLVAAALLLGAVAAGVRLVAAGPWEFVPVQAGPVDVGLRLDVLSTVLLGFVGCVGMLVAAYSARNLVGQARTARFGRLLMATLAALVLLVGGASLPVIAVGWTLSGLALAALVAQPGTAAARRASAYVRRTLLFGDAALWLGVSAAAVLLPTVNRSGLAGTTLETEPATVVAAFLVVACVIRSALVPMQSWLPETAEAPSPVSAFLHAGIVNGAGVMVALLWPVFVAAPAILLVLLVAGAASVMFGTLAARARADVKGKLACSTTAQMGYLAIQLGLGLPAAAVLHLIGHGFYKAWLFLRAGGSVSRERWKPSGPVRAPEANPRVAVGPAVLTAAVGLILAAPAVGESIHRLGPVAVLPPALAITAAVLGVAATARRRSMRRLTGGVVAVSAGAAAGGYAWALVGWESLLAPSLPPTPLWPAPVAGLLLMGVALVAAATILLVQSMATNPVSWLAVRLTRSALPPWTKTLKGTAAWPQPAAVHVAGYEAFEAALVRELVETTASVAAPAWPLRTVVAANPLANLQSFTFDDAAVLATKLWGTTGYSPASAYRRWYAEGRITRDDLLSAAWQRCDDRGETCSDDELDRLVESAITAIHDGSSQRVPGAAPPVRFTELIDRQRGSHPRLANVADDHAALWCQRAWSRSLDDGAGPWELWLQTASTSAYDRTIGLGGVSALVRRLPSDPAEALAWLLTQSGVPTGAHVSYLCALLTCAPGWSGHAAWRARQSGSSQAILELVALRAALDLLLAGSSGTAVDYPLPCHPATAKADNGWTTHRILWQLALEHGFRAPLIDQIRPRARQSARLNDGPDEAVTSAAAQLVFCIDVRSERLRRCLEASGPYDTFGFAGFFGAALEYQSPDGGVFEQCPALIRPSFTVAARGVQQAGLRTVLHDATVAATTAPMTPFVIAEAGGVLAGVAGLLQTFLPARWQRLVAGWTTGPDRWGPEGLSIRADHEALEATECGTTLPVGLPLADRAALAANALRAIGMVKTFAPLLIICGHGATMENNAFSSAYDCGACGGNSGHINARVLADILNDPDVRHELRNTGVEIPSSTVAVAAVHDTTTDDVALDPWFIPRGEHQELLARLRRDLVRAGDLVRAERSLTLPGSLPTSERPVSLAQSMRARAGDWAQPFPEWGLAGNAAFVIGPRRLTSGLDLAGRVFLHDYQPSIDSDDSILEAILTAPTVVTQWINSQYYASTVDYEIFGAGDKATHNIVGDVGVLTGAHGDIRQGLPWQALFAANPQHHPETRQHEPLRLLVLVWASPSSVAAIVLRHQLLQSLICNEWLALTAIDPNTGSMHRLSPHLAWQPVERTSA